MITPMPTKASRKVQCWVLTSNNKNLKANTMTVLYAMIQSLLFVPFGQRRVVWESVVQLCRERNRDMDYVIGVLCESRYVLVWDKYQAAQAAAIATSGTAEDAPTEQDGALENLIGLEEAFDKEQSIDLQAKNTLFKAIADDKRDAAVARVLTGNACESAETSTSSSESNIPIDLEIGHIVGDDVASTGVVRQRRKRRGQEHKELLDIMRSSAEMFKSVPQKYLRKQ
ncbi:MAG: hypothetical protein J3R72DRAFT_428261 [Linnemannia gamsii]|nr:MAG: hypothetical protein J3R72DRAFT_428261 [Linnemannia gamsii]